MDTTLDLEWKTGIASRDPWVDPNVIAERKHDGWRGVLHFGAGESRLLSRTGRDLGASLPYLLPATGRSGLTVLDCEIVAGTCSDDVARAVGGKGRASLVCFDVLVCGGVDVRGLPYIERCAVRDVAVAELRGQGVCVIEVQGVTDGKRDYFDGIVDAGGEGVVLKDLRAAYGHGLVKAKRADTVDCIVTAYDTATGSLVLGMWRDGLRVEVARVPSHALAVGTVVEIEATGWTRFGRLRHARLVRVRDDKPARECRV